MAFQRYDPTKPLSLSYSGGSTLQECERKFCYKYLCQLERDTDFVSPDYFSMGNAFHKVLEITKHDPKQFGKIDFQGIVKSYNLDPHEDGGRIAAMLRRYWILHTTVPLAVAGCELKFEGTYTNGVVDAVLVEQGGVSEKEAKDLGLSNVRGAWWICDLKTASKADNSMPTRLQNDPQLNLYASFRSAIASMVNVDSELFAGVRYRETTKPGQKPKAGESFESWTGRCSEGTLSREIVIPASKMDLKGAFDNFSELVKRAHELQRDFLSDRRYVGRCNFKACLNYARPCEWFSKCYGRNYTEQQRTTLINSVGKDDKVISLGSLFGDLEDAQAITQIDYDEFT